jgi:hypothetical protein
VLLRDGHDEARGVTLEPGGDRGIEIGRRDHASILAVLSVLPCRAAHRRAAQEACSAA